MTDEFPSDIMRAAREAAALVYDQINWTTAAELVRKGTVDENAEVKAAARAILAERQRAAKVAEAVGVLAELVIGSRADKLPKHLSDDVKELCSSLAEEIAQAILKGEPT
jgi:hypothetical protein